MTRSIKELAPKPSDAIKAMIQGLNTLPNETFQIRMSTFGKRVLHSKICYGCAATCTIHQLAGKLPNYESIFLEDHADYLGLDRDEVGTFEDAIDDFRSGRPRVLIDEFYEDLVEKIPYGELEEVTTHQDWCLTTDDWREQIPKIEEYVEKLIALGL